MTAAKPSIDIPVAIQQYVKRESDFRLPRASARLTIPSKSGEPPSKRSDRPVNWNRSGGVFVGSEKLPLSNSPRPTATSAAPNSTTNSLFSVVTVQPWEA